MHKCVMGQAIYGHWQTAPTEVLDGQVDNFCHVPLQDGGTQLALYRSLLGLRAALLLLVEYAHTPSSCKQGGVFIRHSEMRLHSVSGEPPFHPGSRGLRLGVNDKLAVGHGTRLPRAYRMNRQS